MGLRSKSPAVMDSSRRESCEGTFSVGQIRLAAKIADREPRVLGRLGVV